MKTFLKQSIGKILMAEFNPDGSIKLPGFAEKSIKDKENRFSTQRCIKIRKEIVSDRSPKKCVLKILLSDNFKDNSFVQKTYSYFREKAEVPTKLSKINEKEFEVEVGTCFRRCSDCNSLISRFKEFLDGNVIEDKGSCSYEGRSSSNNFCYEDYFD